MKGTIGGLDFVGAGEGFHKVSGASTEGRGRGSSPPSSQSQPFLPPKALDISLFLLGYLPDSVWWTPSRCRNTHSERFCSCISPKSWLWAKERGWLFGKERDLFQRCEGLTKSPGGLRTRFSRWAGMREAGHHHHSRTYHEVTWKRSSGVAVGPEPGPQRAPYWCWEPGITLLSFPPRNRMPLLTLQSPHTRRAWGHWLPILSYHLGYGLTEAALCSQNKASESLDLSSASQVYASHPINPEWGFTAAGQPLCPDGTCPPTPQVNPWLTEAGVICVWLWAHLLFLMPHGALWREWALWCVQRGHTSNTGLSSTHIAYIWMQNQLTYQIKEAFKTP